MAKNILLVIARDKEEYAKRLKGLQAAALPDLDIIVPENEEDIRRHIDKANILLANPILVKPYINDAKKLEWMQSVFAGIDALTAPGLQKNYVLTNVRDVYGEAIAEYVFAYILLVKKRVLEHIEYQKARAWTQRSQATLKGETLCILGAGSIGREIARVGKAVGLRVLGYRTTKVPTEHFDAMYVGNELKEFLMQGDYIVSVLPRTKATDDIVNAESISWMKPTAMFINVGRGNAVDEETLVAAVREGKLAKVVLDVFKQEPLPSESSLWREENIFITPHVSGYILSDNIYEIFKENYRRFRAGEEFLYRVDFAKGY